jgi:hypothetical protein
LKKRNGKRVESRRERGRCDLLIKAPSTLLGPAYDVILTIPALFGENLNGHAHEVPRGLIWKRRPS